MKHFHLVTIGLLAAILSTNAQAQPAPVLPTSGSAATNTIVGPALYVSNMDNSLRFYRDALGMSVRMKFGPKEKPDVLVGFGSDVRQPSLMLLSDRVGTTPRKIEHVHGFDRVALNVLDIRALQARLRAAGFQTDEIRTVHQVVLMTMATDPDGYKIELVQAPMMK